MSSEEPYLGLSIHASKWQPVCLVILVFFLKSWPQPCLGQDQPSESARGTPPEVKANAELQLYKEALTNKGSTDQMRLNAANLLLVSPDQTARMTLLEVLGQSENNPARVAVCKALSEASPEHRQVQNREDFIAPLAEILRTEQDASTAELAAEAMLLFDYSKVSEFLDGIVKDATLATQARLNAVYALKLQPDKRAVLKLIELLGESDEEVGSAAKSALEFLGVAIDPNGSNVEQVEVELQRQEDKEFLRNLAIRWVTRTRDLDEELLWWKQRYLDALDKAYAGTNEDAAKVALLSEYLKSSKKIVRLWALEKVTQSRIGATVELSAQVGPILVHMISDPDRDIRLKTAKLLSLMGGIHAGDKLLARLSVEQDDEVRTEVFVALGMAVYYGLLPNPTSKISPEVRNRTLQFAAEYLFAKEQRKAQEGAEVIKKLLERDGIASTEVERYLGLLSQRYEQEKGNSEGLLRGELLGKMAALCAQGSGCRVEASELFRPLFAQALADKKDLVRQAAVEGLVHTGKTATLARVRDSELLNDPNPAIRKALIALAGEVGGREDLAWLWEKVGAAAESDLAWGAMLRIFKRCELEVFAEWTDKLSLSAEGPKLSEGQMLVFFEIAEQKAAGKENTEMLRGIWAELAQLYKRSGKFAQAADYLGRLHETAESSEERQSIVPSLLDVYLRWPEVDKAAKLVHNCLLTNDLEPNSPVVLSIERYLREGSGGVDPNEVLGGLIARIGPVDDRPQWQEHLRRWNRRLGPRDGMESESDKAGS